MNGEKKYKIALVDDESLFLKGLTMLVNINENMEVVLSAENGDDLLTKLSETEELPDLLLCDLEMPVKNGVDVTKALASSYPTIKVVILSSHYEPSLILKMLEIGASAFMPKNEKPDDFYLTITNVIEKGFHYNEFIVQLIREKMLFGSKKQTGNFANLTEREEEILKLICDQKTNKDIGEEIFISSRTVEGHRNRLLEKTGSKNTAGLIIYAIENGYYSVKILNKWDNKIG